MNLPDLSLLLPDRPRTKTTVAIATIALALIPLLAAAAAWATLHVVRAEAPGERTRATHLEAARAARDHGAAILAHKRTLSEIYLLIKAPENGAEEMTERILSAARGLNADAVSALVAGDLAYIVISAHATDEQAKQIRKAHRHRPVHYGLAALAAIVAAGMGFAIFTMVFHCPFPRLAERRPDAS